MARKKKRGKKHKRNSSKKTNTNNSDSNNVSNNKITETDLKPVIEPEQKSISVELASPEPAPLHIAAPLLKPKAIIKTVSELQPEPVSSLVPAPQITTATPVLEEEYTDIIVKMLLKNIKKDALAIKLAEEECINRLHKETEAFIKIENASWEGLVEAERVQQEMAENATKIEMLKYSEHIDVMKEAIESGEAAAHAQVQARLANKKAKKAKEKLDKVTAEEKSKLDKVTAEEKAKLENEKQKITQQKVVVESEKANNIDIISKEVDELTEKARVAQEIADAKLQYERFLVKQAEEEVKRIQEEKQKEKSVNIQLNSMVNAIRRGGRRRGGMRMSIF